MQSKLVTILILIALGTAGCSESDDTGSSGGPGPGDDGGDADDGDGDGTDDGAAPSGGDDGDDDGGDGTDESTEDGDGDTGGAFIQEPDSGGGAVECDLWAQDCPAGEKCMPWANDGGGAWNATKCSPVVDDPGQPGDDCSAVGSGVSGEDSCDVASMCWSIDGETGIGYCVALCQGSPAAPTCEDPGTACSIGNDGILPLCLPTCDPLIQDCPNEDLCLPNNGTFVCVIDASGEGGQYGDPCEYANVCDAGLLCLGAEFTPGCEGSVGCCSEYCDVTEPDASSKCSGAAGGQECQAFYEEGQAPPGLGHVGICAIPTG
jgi:hypothetical protein